MTLDVIANMVMGTASSHGNDPMSATPVVNLPIDTSSPTLPVETDSSSPSTGSAAATTDASPTHTSSSASSDSSSKDASSSDSKSTVSASSTSKSKSTPTPHAAASRREVPGAEVQLSEGAENSDKKKKENHGNGPRKRKGDREKKHCGTGSSEKSHGGEKETSPKKQCPLAKNMGRETQPRRQGEHEEEHVPIHAGGRKPNHGDERHRRTLPGREQQHGQGGEVDHAHGGPGDEGENNAMEDGKKHGDRNVHLAVGSRRIRERERINNIVVQVARTSRTKSRVKKLLGPMIANLSVEGMKAKPRMGRRLPQASVNYGADLI
ncbi:hypothetical protein EV359DRAFT_62958 [Lentinula novae-zelandiae]|nr:hypothetical protein EV359DRAFT_62958 [Lentinula novae-zelandiae]